MEGVEVQQAMAAPSLGEAMRLPTTQRGGGGAPMLGPVYGEEWRGSVVNGSEAARLARCGLRLLRPPEAWAAIHGCSLELSVVGDARSCGLGWLQVSASPAGQVVLDGAGFLRGAHSRSSGSS